MLLQLSDGRIHYEKFSDGSIVVLLRSAGVTWEQWSNDAKRIRKQLGEVQNSLLDAPVFIGGPQLRPSPRYLAREFLPKVFEPLVSILVDDPEDFKEAHNQALTACGEAGIDRMKNQRFRHPEFIAQGKGSLRSDNDLTYKRMDGVKDMVDRFNTR